MLFAPAQKANADGRAYSRNVCSRPVNFIGREIFVREEYCRTFQTGAFSVVLTDIGLLTDSLVDYMKTVSEYRNVHFAVRCILR